LRLIALATRHQRGAVSDGGTPVGGINMPFASDPAPTIVGLGVFGSPAAGHRR
jgi:hypothetical protein